jgi:hypothetical protein
VVPSDFIELARTILLDLMNSNQFGGFAELWVTDRIQVGLFSSLYFINAASILKVTTKHDRGLRQPQWDSHNVRGNG